MSDLISAPLVMAVVALLALAGAVYTATRPTASEAAVYRQRIAGTMLGAGAIILGGFAFALHSWGTGR